MNLAREPRPAGSSRSAAPAGRSTGAADAAPAKARRPLIRWLLEVTRPVLPPLLGSAACRVADHLLGVALFALAAHAVVAGALSLAAGGPAPSVWPVVGAMAAISVLKAALRYGEQFLGHTVAFTSLELLRAELFRALARRAPRVMSTARSGDLLARSTKDVDRVEVFFAHTFAPAVSAAVVPVTVLVVIGVKTTWAVAAAAAATLAAAIVVVPLLGHRAATRSARHTVAARAELTQHVTDSVQGLPEVVGYGRAAERLERTRDLDDAVAAAARPAALLGALRRGGVQLLVLAGPIAVVAAGAGPVLSGAVGPAALAAAAAAVLRLGETVRGVEELAGSLATALAAAERVHQVATAPTELPDGASALPAGPLDVTWEHVDYTYPGASRPSLRGVSGRAEAGRWTCLVGASGSGKTTLARLVLRFDDPAGGRVTVGGVDVRAAAAENLRARVALVSQQAHLFRLSVTDNVRLARPEATREQVAEACRLAGVHAEVAAMPDGYSTLLGERGASVSGGQRQRFALARALLAEPDVLVLDEFTSHLDPELDARVRDAVRAWAARRGTTVVEVTHRLHRIEQADHVIVVDGGRVVQSGPPAQLLAQAGGPLARLRARQE
ncbi:MULTISPECIES: thiol reductant ABC exporter subunit CydC [unclassified Actinomyces]|uniref:thiol reductant ABC exporter subunit CydC n=1 Tax=unclassified Actinomyces TaxID=2609248 RepID=UPI0013A6EC05|nr:MULTISPECIES: thiol reductant ABC exporter subunit CydC [unclassified Actinomyces]MBW3069194.1 thiol reductant ABC exporter subunit CydC [Actinomyces sp. 594]NDR53374.1 thiol reductant ABC exporter subunit CydC [Actinomyces sp. 565]